MEDLIVIGAGIVGLATAREALRRRPGISVLVLEKADDVASAQTGHNSGVIHAGLYYAPGSLKARLCRAGEKATKDFCDEHGIRYETVGKLVVATNDVEIERMKALAERAAENGIKVEHINGDRLAEMEPNVRGLEALISPATGIVDFRDVAHAMARDIEQMGGRVITRSQVRSIDERSGASGKVVVGSDTGEYHTRQLVACAGLQADRVATMGGLDIDFQIIPFRGEYYQLPHDRWGIVQRLIYPVPDPDLPFLGVHLSPTIDGRITVGPNAVLGFSRERYPRGSITGRDVARFLAFPGMWRFAMNNIQTGVEEMRSSYFPRGYLKLVRKYCPGLELADLRPYPAGIRAQAIMRDGTSVEDFLLRFTDHQLHVCNAPSPAATSAIPIGALIVDKILGSDRD